MKKMKIYRLTLIFLLTFVAFSCTDKFDEINKNPESITADEASAKFFLTSTQADLYGPGRFEYWRAQLIHADRFAGQFTFGSSGSWWSDELSYSYNGGYTNATWDWLEGYFGGLDNFLKITNVGGDFENDRMYAVGLVMKGLYFQLYTDTFGEIPYSGVGVEGVLLPEFNTQKDIYKGIIADLDAAMTTIGSETNTSDIPGDINDLGANDLFFNGDLQMWKKLANSLKLRVAMRAKDATGDDFSAAAITAALLAPLLEAGESALLGKDTEIDQFGSSAYGDVWHNFGGFGSKWTVSQEVIHHLRDYGTDPRLGVFALPAEGGDFTFDKGTDVVAFDKRMAVITGELDDASAVYTLTDNGTTVDLDVTGGYYAGQPVRLGSDIKALVRPEFFSHPGNLVLEPKHAGAQFPEIVMSSAEVYFLRAEAALDGSGEDAQVMFQTGIAESMALWGVDGTNYIATSPLADIVIGTLDEKLEKVAIQRWLAAYTDGFEAWSVVRKSGYPTRLAAGVTDPEIYGLGTLNGDYPQRMRYGSSAVDKNGANLSVALGRQGPDMQGTVLWWAK
jgi:hypothetical protein